MAVISSKLTIEKLLKIEWWNWDVEKITKNLSIITGSNIEELEKIA
jgi:virginiamycin A acetyltransferase